MSHFSVLVLVAENADDVEEKVAELLEPYNENGEWNREGSRWDWWVIGGRWTGALDGYDPEKDPANVETCNLCAGTGMRNDEIGRKHRAQNPEYTCNGCDGEGKRVKWPTQWKRHQGDMVPATKVPSEFTPFALVTPDGAWRESGHMGWFGVSSDNREQDEWAKTVRAILGEWPNTTAVIVDCHV